MRTQESSLPSLQTPAGHFSLSLLTGRVLDANTRTETHVYGGGGGGGMNEGSINIRSTVTTHTNIFLVDENGREHAVALRNFDIVFRPGHVLSLLGAFKNGAANGWHIAAHNHNIRETKFDQDALRTVYGEEKLHRKYRAYIIGLPILLFLLLPVGAEMKTILAVAWAFFGLLFGQIVGGIVARNDAARRADAFKNGKEMVKVLELLKSADLNKYPETA
jgi:hypothetical protein